MAEDEAAGAATTTTMEQQEQEHEQQEQSEQLQEHTEQTATPEPEPEEAGEKKKVKRKPKRRTMDAHFWGMSDAEIASIKASLAADLELEQARAAAQASKDQNEHDGTPAVDDTLVKQEDAGQVQDEPATEEEQQQEQPIPEGQLPPEEIQARRRILHTNWRMAAFSQFTHCFPHLCIKEFSIDKLERDLEGTEPGYYVGEVISRLLYHLTKDSALAGKSPDKPWLIRLRREFLRRDPAHNSLGDGPLYVTGGEYYEDDEEEDNNGEGSSKKIPSSSTLDVASVAPPPSAGISQSAAPTLASTVPTSTTTIETRDASASSSSPAKDAFMSQAKDEEPQQAVEEKSVVPAVTIDGSDIEENKDVVKLDQEGQEQAQDTTVVNEDKPWLAEFPNSKGWEELTLTEQIYALWSITEWHLSNADKFRNILLKYRIEAEQPFWRIEPIGYDKNYNVYWMFDDFRLWVERQTPVRRQQLILLEETAERLKERERLRQKRIRHEQRMRMKALHERRRLRIAAQKNAEANLDAEIAEMDELDRLKAVAKAAGKTNGKTVTGKRKRNVKEVEEEEEEEEFAEEQEAQEDEEEEQKDSPAVRSSRRTTKAKAEVVAPTASTSTGRSDRRRSTRNSSAHNVATATGVNGHDSTAAGPEYDEWQKIPAEWMKSEEVERDEDPDFGAEEEEDAEDPDVEVEGSDSELSMLDEDEDVGRSSRKKARSASSRKSTRTSLRSSAISQRSQRQLPQRSSQRRQSPRKLAQTTKISKSTPGESELSDLSEGEEESMLLDEEAEEGEGDADEDDDDDEEKMEIDEEVNGYFPDSAWESYKAVPSFDDEDKDQPEGFVRWELLIKDLPEWLGFSEKYFPEAEDSREVALVQWVEEQVVPKAQAELDRREEIRKKEEAAKKAAERKARIEREKAAAAAAAAAGIPPPSSTTTAAGASAGGPSRTFRSSRIAQKEAKEAEERARAAALAAEERAKYSQTPDRALSAGPTAADNVKTEQQPNPAKLELAESDRRAARAREREDAKKAREEAELMEAFREVEGGGGMSEEAQQYHQIMGSAPPLPLGTTAMQLDVNANVPSTSALPALMVPSTSAMPVPMFQQYQQQQPQQQQGQFNSGDMQAYAPSSAHVTSEQSAQPEVAEMVDEGADDYFLDCSVCKKRGLNLDANTRLVACDNCDRWEHVVCHRKADEKAGRPKRDFDNDPFLCEDCEDLESSVILPSAPKRARSDKQKEGARRGAEKRKAKSAALRAKKAGSQPLKPVQKPDQRPPAPVQVQAAPVAGPSNTAASPGLPAMSNGQLSAAAVPGMSQNSQNRPSPSPSQMMMQQQFSQSPAIAPGNSRQPSQPGGQPGQSHQMLMQPYPGRSAPPGPLPYRTVPSPSFPGQQTVGMQTLQGSPYGGGQQSPHLVQPNVSHSMPSPLPQQLPPQAQQQYVNMQQQGGPGSPWGLPQAYPATTNGPGFQSAFAGQASYPTMPAQRMYPANNGQGAYAGRMSPSLSGMQQQHRQQTLAMPQTLQQPMQQTLQQPMHQPMQMQGNFQPGFPNFAYGGQQQQQGPSHAFAPQHMAQSGYPIQQQQQQPRSQQQQQFVQGHPPQMLQRPNSGAQHHHPGPQ